MERLVGPRIVALVAVFSATFFVSAPGHAAPPPILDTFTHDHCVWGDPLLGDDGFLYLTTGPCDDFRGSGLTKVDPDGGRVVWGPMSEHPRCSSESTTHSMSAHGTLFADSQDDGELAWSRSGGKCIGGEGMGIDSMSGVVYGSVDGSSGPVRAYRGDGTARWFKSVNTASWDRGRVVAVTEANAVLVHHAAPNRLRAFEPVFGTELWSADGLNAVVTDEAETSMAPSPRRRPSSA